MLCRTAILIVFSCLLIHADDRNEELLAAVRKGDLAAVQELLSKGADVNAKSPYGATPLFFAADRGNIAIIRILLEHGADVNVKDTFYGATALSWAAQKDRIEIIKLLLAKGATGVDDLVMTAVSKGNLEMLKTALENGNVKSETLTSAFAVAVKNHRADLAEWLKKSGATEPAKADFRVDPEILNSYAGTYSAEGMDFKFEVKEGKLLGGPSGQKPLTFGALDKTTFRPDEFPGVTLIFNVEAGKVIGATVKSGSSTTILKKAGAQ